MIEEPVQQKQTNKEIFQSSVKDAQRVMENTEIIGNPRLGVIAGLLGVCVVFFSTMLNVPKIDHSLTVSLIAFSLATPILCTSYLWASYKVKRVPGYILLQSMLIGAWIAEALGTILVLTGILFVVIYLSNTAFIAWLAATIFALFLVPFFSFIGLIIYAIIQGNKEQKKGVE